MRSTYFTSATFTSATWRKPLLCERPPTKSKRRGTDIQKPAGSRSQTMTRMVTTRKRTILNNVCKLLFVPKADSPRRRVSWLARGFRSFRFQVLLNWRSCSENMSLSGFYLSIPTSFCCNSKLLQASTVVHSACLNLEHPTAYILATSILRTLLHNPLHSSCWVEPH